MDKYTEFLSGKLITAPPTGLAEVGAIHESLFPFQRDIVAWALRRGRAGVFTGTGTGKTRMELEWARQIPGPVLILCPLAVAEQTVEEGAAIGVAVQYCRDKSEIEERIITTNYEMLEHFDAAYFKGIVVDESSILKSFDGVYRTRIIEMFAQTPFKLSATATPAPNDFMELGSQAEFLGVMTRPEMLSMFFVHDGGDTSQWRIKGHAEKEFWKWVCSWAVMMRMPSDLGYDDGAFVLPPLRNHPVVVNAGKNGDFLFPVQASTLQERIGARRDSVEERCAVAFDVISKSPDTKWVVWCNLNSEQDLITKLLGDRCVSIYGSQSLEAKIKKERAWRHGDIPIMVSKPLIFGWGVNWQMCHKMIFLGISDSWEMFYQAVRRCWRFGQKHPVDVYTVTSKQEGAVVSNLKRKEQDADRMVREMIANMHELNQSNLRGTTSTRDEYQTDSDRGQGWTMNLGDCVDFVKELADESVGLSVFSPPFSSLYTYSASERDMGNCKGDEEFFSHMGFLATELFRVIQTGRHVSFHVMNLPTTKTRDGFIGIRDFRGAMIRLFEDHGFIYHSETCIWKDPVTAMQRTKALGLLWKQLKKDSAMSRMGIPDYLVTMRKPGENLRPVNHKPEDFPVSQWQKWASPVWMDIDPGDTLQRESAREEADERHICPLQLEVIRRAVVLWSNPGDLVLSPFAGIGSEGVVSLQEGRKFVGVELKRSYYEQAVANLRNAKAQGVLIPC